MSIMTILGVVGGALSVSQMFPPVARELQYRTNTAIPNREQEAVELLELARRGFIDRKQVIERLQKHGFDVARSSELLALTDRMLEADELIVLFRRGIIDKSKYDERMLKLGYNSSEAELILTTRQYLPSPTDLVRFAVREVYSPEVIKTFKLEEGFPEEFATEALKVGMDREQALNYWKAHWELPSLSMGFEMFHRRVIGKEELDLLMKTLDINPFWREKLKEISYSPYTRVDARRMYELGVLNETELKNAYLDIGYNEERAQKLVEFTKAYALPAEKDLTRTMIEKAWIQGELTKEEATTYLMDLGYSRDEAGLLISLKENELEEKELDDKLEVIETLLVSGVIDFEEAIERLDKLNLKSIYRDKIYASLVREKEKNLEYPTKSDLEKMLVKGVIDKDEWKTFMERLGFTKELIEKYYKLYTGQELGEN